MSTNIYDTKEDVYELIRKNLISNKEVLCLLTFLEKLCKVEPPDDILMIYILRSLYKNRFIFNFNRNIIPSNLHQFLDDSIDLNTVSVLSQQRQEMLRFIANWIQYSSLSEIDWTEESKTGNNEDIKHYHDGHLCIQRIYAVLMARETHTFLYRIRETYRDSLQLTRVRKWNEDESLNDYTKWKSTDVFLAMDESQTIHFITPFKIKVFFNNGVLTRQLIGGDIVPKPSPLTIKNSFQELIQNNLLFPTEEKPLQRSLILNGYEGVFWIDTEETSEFPDGIDFMNISSQLRQLGRGDSPSKIANDDKYKKSVDSDLLSPIEALSFTDITVRTGKKRFIVSKEILFKKDDSVFIYYSPNVWMEGNVVSYNSTNGELDVNVKKTSTSKPTRNVWTIQKITSTSPDMTNSYKYPIFIDQYFKSYSEFISQFIEEIDIISEKLVNKGIPNIEIADERTLNDIADEIKRFREKQSTGLLDAIKQSKNCVTGVLIGAIAATGIIRVGLDAYYSPNRWKNFYKGKIKIYDPAIRPKKSAKQVAKTVRKMEFRKLRISNSWIKYTGYVETLLKGIKSGYKISQFSEGEWAELGASILTGIAVDAFLSNKVVTKFIEQLANSRILGTSASIRLGANIVITLVVSYLVSKIEDYILNKIDEAAYEELSQEGASLGYAPGAYAYGIKIPMSQFGHIVEASVRKQFLDREEIKTGNDTIEIGAGEYVNKINEKYDWSTGTFKPGVGVPTPEEGKTDLWPVNFKPESIIQSAKGAIKKDFDIKNQNNLIDPNLKSVPPKLQSEEEAGILFPEFPWGIPSSTCIPSFVDAAKEAQRNNQLFGDIEKIYQYYEFMNTIGKVVSTPDGLIANISKMTSLSFANSYYNSLSEKLIEKVLFDTEEVIDIIESENNPNGEFTSGTNITVNSGRNTIIIQPYRKITTDPGFLLTSKSSIRPNSDNKSRDGKDLPIGKRTSSSDYVRRPFIKYFPNNRLSKTKVVNDIYPPPTDVNVIIPSFATNTLRDVRSTNPLVRILTTSERNSLRLASAPSTGKTNIEDYILTDVPIFSSPGSTLKLDESLLEGSCALKKSQRGDSPSRPDREEDRGGGGRGPAGGGTCFPEYTKILTPSGYIKISEMNVGDKIIAFDDGGSLVESSVTHKFVHDGEESTDVFSYTLSNGNEIHITDNHPVLVPTGDFSQIGSLKMGDSIIDESGNEIQLVSKKFIEKSVVYNLEVEKYHTYIADGIRVHNLIAKGGGPKSSDPFRDLSDWRRRNPYVIVITDILVDDSKRSGNDEAVGSGRDNPFLPTCFPSWSIVTTENGGKPISEILVGDKIFTLNRESGKIETSMVTDIKKHEDENYLVSRYELSDGGHIDITKNHPVLTPSGYFKSIGKLTIGDLIVTENGESVSIVNEYHLDDCHVYNLQVESNQSYIVNGIIVSDR